MNLIAEIRNYQVKSPLPPEKIKISREYEVMAILKYSFPERFAGLRKAEAPDLQDAKRNLGIEVTSALSPRDEQITGESIKYSHAKTEAEREKCLRIIHKCGGTKDEISIHEQFQHVGLAILIDIPLFFFMILNWENG